MLIVFVFLFFCFPINSWHGMAWHLVSWQSFSPESEPFEARSRGKESAVSLRSSGSKSFVRHLTSESRSQDLNRRERLFNFCSLVC